MSQISEAKRDFRVARVLPLERRHGRPGVPASTTPRRRCRSAAMAPRLPEVGYLALVISRSHGPWPVQVRLRARRRRSRGPDVVKHQFARHARAPRDVATRVDSFPPLFPSSRASSSLSPDAGMRRRAREPSAAARGQGAGSFPRVPHRLRARRTPRRHLLRARRPSHHRRVAPTRVHRPSPRARPRLRGGARLVPPTRHPRRAPARESTPRPRRGCTV
jgi:hypothetical protein